MIGHPLRGRRLRLAVTGGVLMGVAALSSATGASAQTRPVLAIGKVASEKECSLYESYWGTWLILECRNNFAAMRARLSSALEESGKLTIATRAPLQVTAAITELGITTSQSSGAGYGAASRRAVASMDVRVMDTARGRLVWGGTVTKSIEAGSGVVGEGVETSTGSSPRAIYTELQRQISLAAARAVSFHFTPLRVTEVDGARVELNYGGPLLSLGDLVEARGGDGRAARYRVISTTGTTASAESVNGGAPPATGAEATFIEADSTAANARRYDKVDLPPN